jgi:predicted ATP-grasp superfamily ATP-dependent carboligase
MPADSASAGSVASRLDDPRLRPVFKSEIPAVVVFPVSHPVGLSVIRTLTGHGMPILALDFKPKAAGLYSRHATPLLLPGLYDDAETFARGMVELGARFRVPPVLFLVDDEDLFLSLKRRDEFSHVYRLPLSAWDVVEPIVDKGQLYRRLQALHYPVPASWFPSSTAELAAWRERLPFPCIVKPTYSTAFRQRFGVKAKRFDSFEPLAAFVDVLLDERYDFVVQEFIEGPAESLYTYAAYSDDNGEVIASFTGRKLRQFPPDFGTCRLGESVESAALEEAGARLLKILRYRGISLTEFKRDADGSFQLIELNPRPGDWPERLAQLCGANLVLTAYRNALGEHVAPHRATRFGVKWANIAEDLYYCVRGYRLFGHPEEERGWLRWLRDMRGLESGAFFAWSDPLPAFVRFVAMVREFRARERALRR